MNKEMARKMTVEMLTNALEDMRRNLDKVLADESLAGYGEWEEGSYAGPMALMSALMREAIDQYAPRKGSDAERKWKKVENRVFKALRRGAI